MARRRFFVEQVRNQRAELTGEDARHLTRVLRVEKGQQYEISDGDRAWLAEVESAHKDQVAFHVLERLEPEPAEVRIVLLAALIKFDHFELLVEKATELGVAEIIPVGAARSERGLERAAVKRVDRWRRIALEASQQSRRTHLPVIGEPVEFRRALERDPWLRLFLDEEQNGGPLLASLPAVRTAQDSVAVMIGPEGGWTDEERSAAHSTGWTSVSLGRRILRAETAAIASLAVLQAAWQIE
jgi:16S rRNA (uracil1498-N3)-methyltransferase